MKQKLTLFAFLNFCVLFLKAQDPHFSQYYQNLTLINPAYCGNANAIRASLNYKNQWGSVASPFKTLAFALDANMTKRSWDNAYLGGGLLFTNDKRGAGQINSNSFGGLLGSGVQLGSESFVSVGFQANYVQSGVSIENYTTDVQFVNGAFDPTASTGETFSNTTISYMDLGAGLLYTYGQAESYKTKSDEFAASFGIGYYHLSQPLLNYTGVGNKLAPLVVIHGSTHIGIPLGTTSFSPSFVSFIQGKQNEFIIGTTVSNQLKQNSRYTGFVKSAAISFGAHYRVKDAIILSMLYENAGYGFGISYDINSSKLKTASNGKGGVELTLRYVNLGK